MYVLSFRRSEPASSASHACTEGQNMDSDRPGTITRSSTKRQSGA